jgi:hypothetical protein
VNDLLLGHDLLREVGVLFGCEYRRRRDPWIPAGTVVSRLGQPIYDQANAPAPPRPLAGDDSSPAQVEVKIS